MPKQFAVFLGMFLAKTASVIHSFSQDNIETNRSIPR